MTRIAYPHAARGSVSRALARWDAARRDRGVSARAEAARRADRADARVLRRAARARVRRGRAACAVSGAGGDARSEGVRPVGVDKWSLKQNELDFGGRKEMVDEWNGRRKEMKETGMDQMRNDGRTGGGLPNGMDLKDGVDQERHGSGKQAEFRTNAGTSKSTLASDASPPEARFTRSVSPMPCSKAPERTSAARAAGRQPGPREHRPELVPGPA